MQFINRFFNKTDNSFFLFGSRGCGKTTWLKQNYPNAMFIDLLDTAITRSYAANPERLSEVVHASNQKIIVVDEIQKVPELLSVVHQLIELKKGWQFILTGSSSRKLKRTGVNLLGGRAIIRHLHPFMAAELGNDFDLNKALQFGLVPIVVDNKVPEEILDAYIGLYLKEEVQAEGLVRNIGNFSRFLEIASFSHGNIINLSNIARECEVSRKLVENYLSIVEDLLLGFTLPVFTKRAKRQLTSHPKFYYFDVGVFNNLRPRGPLDRKEEIGGVALEGLVAQHLRAWNDYKSVKNALYYWRTRAGVEVDFVIYGPDDFLAIEVKHTNIVHSKDLRGLKIFCQDYPEATPILLHRGKEKFKKDNILCIPVEEFLKQLTPENYGIHHQSFVQIAERLGKHLI